MSSRSLAPVCRSRGDGSFLRSASTVDEQQEYLMSENNLPDELSESPPGRYRPPGYASADKRRRAIALFEAGIGYTKASRILDLPSTTLRDWAEAWKSGKFSVEISPNLYRYSDAVRTKAIAMRLSGSTWKAIRAATRRPQRCADGSTPIALRRSANLRNPSRANKNGTINGGAARQEAHLRPRRPQDPKSAEGTA